MKHGIRRIVAGLKAARQAVARDAARAADRASADAEAAGSGDSGVEDAGTWAPMEARAAVMVA